ncbi:hypothetical protein J42TS3_43570 [Paenibacillus vini]|uniref:Phage capsid protein n=2 Tax=Paenibacillus vini TaxID=1476024 RepID=A0ABQ4MH55_9BACL|nr:hypothetical protein J42TS3_43570 [Paenibacillus vini]
MECPYNPDGRGFQSQRTKRTAMNRAYEKDKQDLDKAGDSLKKVIYFVIAIAVLYFLIFRL